MKKCVILVLVCCLLTLTACGGTAYSPPAAQQPTKTTEVPTTTTVAPVPSDYANAANWLMRPIDIIHPVDVIYLYPTTYATETDTGRMFFPIDDATMRARAALIYESQATAFETVGNMYAPFYRQLDGRYLAALNEAELTETLSAEPLTDLTAALDYYFQNDNGGRPFILAGHSQGSCMMSLLLSGYMKEHPDYYSRMIAAYQIGYGVTADYLAQNPHLKFAAGADDTGVIVSWNTEGAANAGQHNMVVPAGSISINPLNWTTDGTYAGVEENLGSLLPDGSSAYIEQEGIADAQVDTARGVVICSSVDAAVYANPNAVLFGPESYHAWDYSFYYANLRENAQLRADTYFAAQEAAA